MPFIKLLVSILLLKTILPSSNTDAQTSGCGGTYSDQSGTISSPNYPSNYDDNLNCSYYIHVSLPNYVNITFISFYTELSFDWLMVSCSSNSTIFAQTFTGADVPPPLSISHCSTVLLQFFTDGSNTGQGFSLRYDSYSDCGTYSNLSGIISSPNYPSSYDNNLNCLYYIQISPPNSVNITFMSFATESCCDWLQVSCTSDSTKPVQRFYGTDLPPFLSISSCYSVQLLFHTDGSVVVKGFSLRYDIGNGLQGGLTMKPMNLYVRNDSTEPIVLSCSSRANQPDAYPWWSYNSNNNPSYSEILTTSTCSVSSRLISSYFSTTKQYSSRTCNLTISRSIFPSATGKYTCTDSTLDFSNALIILVDPSYAVVYSPSTTEVVRDDQISVTCRVQVFQSTLSDLRLVPSIYAHSGDNQFPVIVSSSAVSFIALATPGILPAYGCEINFTFSGNFPKGCATNVPQSISFTTPIRQVLYWPENPNMVIQGDDKGRVVANGNLTCFVPANPQATYQWTNEEFFNPWKGPTVAVSKNGTYTCIATNIIRGKTYEASKSINVTVIDGYQPLPSTEKNDPEDKLNWVALAVGVVLGIAVLLLLVATIVLLICRRRKKIPNTNPCSDHIVTAVATTNGDPQNNNFYEMIQRNTLSVEGSENRAYDTVIRDMSKP